MESLNERYNPNRFVLTENIDPELHGKSYRYFVRPYVPFWSAQKLQFEQVNNESEVQSSRTTMTSCSKRYVFHHLVKKWLNEEPWFDKKDIYELVEEDLILNLDSISYGYKKEMIRTYLHIYQYICYVSIHFLHFEIMLNFRLKIFFFLTTENSFENTEVPEFGKHIDTILDAWLLYQMKSFGNPSHSSLIFVYLSKY